MKPFAFLSLLTAGAAVAAALTIGAGGGGSAQAGPPLGILHKIKHVVVIMQENRTFDSYFGTYPGADGLPAGVCVPDPATGACVAPYHDPNDLNHGGPHN